MAQNLRTAPQVNVAVQGQQGTQPEGTFLNLINWIGNVIAPVGAGGAALMAIGSFAMGRGFGKWVFTAIGLLMVSGVTRLLEYWIAQAPPELLKPTLGQARLRRPGGVCPFLF
jgi:hypothetical protein